MTAYKEFKRDVAWLIAIGFVSYVVLNAMRVGYDSTDGTTRSGLGLYTDAITGCQYLSAGLSGITPRLSADGHHVCTPQPEGHPHDE